MAHISKFGLENFRVFKDHTWFDFSPITIITGQNSSGKSSLFKALKVLRNNISRDEDVKKSLETFTTKFENGDLEQTGLGTLKECLSYKSKKDYLSYSFKVNFPLKKEKLLLTIAFKSKTNDLNTEGTPYRLTLSKEVDSRIVLDFNYLGSDHYANIDIGFFRSSLSKYVDYTNNFIKEKSECKESFFREYDQNIDDEKKYHQMLEDYNESRIENYNKKVKTFGLHKGLYNYLSASKHNYYGDELVSIPYNSNYPLYPFLPFFIISERKIQAEASIILAKGLRKRIIAEFEEHKEKLKDALLFKGLSFSEIAEHLVNIEEQFFKNAYMSSEVITNYKEKFGDLRLLRYFEASSIDHFIKYSNRSGGYDLVSYIENYAKWIVDQTEELKVHNNLRVFEKYLEYGITKALNSIKVFKDLEFIDSVRINNQRIFTSESSNKSFYKALVDYLKLSKNDNGKRPDIAFVKKYLREFGISKTGEFTIKSFEDYSGIQVFIDDRLISDYGSGVNHLFHILIKVCVIFLRYNRGFTYYDESTHSEEDVFWNEQLTVFIEEPELNLHPNLQSKLADMFVEANKEFEIQFIIETHSEYLIRKLQYLTAKNEIKPEDTAIYYFHNPSNIPEGENQVKRIEIRSDGMFKNDFGSGFFDESVLLTIDLLKIQSAN